MPVKAKKMLGAADPYLELVRTVYPLRPIRNAEEHDQALRALRSLGNDNREVAVDFKVVLAGIIETYERRNTPQLDTSHVTTADVVRHLLADRGLSVTALARECAISHSTLSEMLSGKRAWSVSISGKVADYFGLSRDLFLK